MPTSEVEDVARVAAGEEEHDAGDEDEDAEQAGRLERRSSPRSIAAFHQPKNAASTARWGSASSHDLKSTFTRDSRSG